MGTRQGRVYSSLLFQPLYSAVRGPGTHPPLRQATCVYTASRPRLNSLFTLLLPALRVCECVLINQSEGIQLRHRRGG